MRSQLSRRTTASQEFALQPELAGLRRVHLAQFFELDAQPVAERALGSQFVQQAFGLIEVFERKILRLEQIAKAALNLIFGKQGSLSRLPLR
jgi:hypothetical protein